MLHPAYWHWLLTSCTVMSAADPDQKLRRRTAVKSKSFSAYKLRQKLESMDKWVSGIIIICTHQILHRSDNMSSSISPVLAQFDPVSQPAAGDCTNTSSLIDLTSHTPVLNSLQTSVLSHARNDNHQFSPSSISIPGRHTDMIAGVRMLELSCLRPPSS